MAALLVMAAALNPTVAVALLDHLMAVAHAKCLSRAGKWAGRSAASSYRSQSDRPTLSFDFDNRGIVVGGRFVAKTDHRGRSKAADTQSFFRSQFQS